MTWHSLKLFLDGPDAKRLSILVDLRNKPDGARLIAMDNRSCQLGQRSTVSIVKEYRYPTEFTTKDDLAIPSAFETRNLGSTMLLDVSWDKSQTSIVCDIDIHTVELNKTQRYPASKRDRTGTIEQPIFTTEDVRTKVALASDVPELVGA